MLIKIEGGRPPEGRDTPVGRGLGRSAPADPVFSHSHILTF